MPEDLSTEIKTENIINTFKNRQNRQKAGENLSKTNDFIGRNFVLKRKLKGTRKAKERVMRKLVL